MNRDFVFGSAALALAAIYYVLAAAIPESALADTVGPQGLPKIYALLLGGLSILLIARSIRDRNRGSRTSGPGGSPIFRIATILAIGIAYIIVVPWLGYALSLAGLIVATARFQGGIGTRHVVVVALAGAVLFWLLFVRLLGIPHPPGIWPELF